MQQSVSNQLNKEKSQCVVSLVDYIESHLTEMLNTDELASVGFASRSKVYRDFYSMTGHPVKEYIRKRRLSNALALVKQSALGLSDIASQCGYSSQQSFCRCVQRGISMTPLAYRESERYYYFPPFRGETICDVSVEHVKIPQLYCVRYISNRITGIENRAVSALFARIPSYSERLSGRNGSQIGNKFCYELYLTDKTQYAMLLKDGKFEDGGETKQDNGYFALTVVKNEKEKIEKAWDYLDRIWLERSMYCYNGNNYFEEYLLHDGKVKRLKLYFPISPRKEFPRIRIMKKKEAIFLVAGGSGRYAEKHASKKVLQYLAEDHTNFLKFVHEFFVKETQKKVIYGVRIEKEDENFVEVKKPIQKIVMPEGEYLILDGGTVVDYSLFKEILESFAEDNGIHLTQESVFGLYNTDYGFQNPRLSLYGRVKLETK